MKVQGTGVSGRRVGTGAFLAQVDAIDPTQHAHLHEHAVKGKHCC